MNTDKRSRDLTRAFPGDPDRLSLLHDRLAATAQQNRILDSGADDGVGVDVQGETESIAIARNEIRETRAPMARIGVRVGKQAGDVDLADNRIEGYAVAISDLRQR